MDHTVERLLARFATAEREWDAYRSSLAKHVRAVAASAETRVEVLPSSPSLRPPSAVARLPRGHGINPPSDVHRGRGEEDDRARSRLLDAVDTVLPALLDDMDECVSFARQAVRHAWQRDAAADPAAAAQGCSAALDRGASGGCTSPVDAAQATAAKLACYQVRRTARARAVLEFEVEMEGLAAR